MSDYLAVGAVSAVLRSLLTTALTSGGPSTILVAPPGVTATSPDLVPTGQDEPPRVNLFMYYASFNAALRNLDFPARDSQGVKVSNPRLALNLHYLVSAYGSNQFDPEILLAWAMEVFHNTPVVARQTIQDALTSLLGGPATPEAQLIAASSLANQIESIKITPEALSTEEIYRLWTAFQAKYRPTTSYQISVVVIQGTEPFASNLLVRHRTVTALPLQPPTITSLTPAMIVSGGLLTIAGSNFVGDNPADTVVSFDSAPGIAPSTLQGNLMRVGLPSTLLAGTRTVRVQRQITFPLSTAPHPGFSSDPALFQLLPTITNATPITVARGSTLTLQLTPDVGQTQNACAYIGDTAIQVDERPVSDPAVSPTIDFPIPAEFPTGSYPLRVEIDGAQSPLTFTAGAFYPRVQVQP